ncbi:MAG: ribonuclease P protein component [Pseudomonadota bacterium]
MEQSLPAKRKFPRKLRLHLNSDFIKLRRKGKRVSGKHLFMMVGPAAEDRTRLGISISKKVGIAVNRNRLRRRIKEIVRHNPDRLPPCKDILIGCRRGSAELDMDRLEEEVLKLLEKLNDK